MKILAYDADEQIDGREATDDDKYDKIPGEVP